MEVYNDRPDAASEMITNLGDYIRISLSAGNNQHTIESELEQVTAYVDIMSCRFSKSIGMVINVPDELRPRMILKSILQPLVENSLKHGFNISGGGVPIAPASRSAPRCRAPSCASRSLTTAPASTWSGPARSCTPRVRRVPRSSMWG